MTDERKLTVKEAAELLDVATATITKWCRTGKLPNAERIMEVRGAYWLIPESDLKSIGEVKRGRPRKY